MKYLGPFLIGSIITVGGFLGVAATLPTPEADVRTPEQRAADAVMLAPQPLTAAQRRPEPQTPDRTITPIAWPEAGPEATASLGQVPRPVAPAAPAEPIAAVPAEPIAAALPADPPEASPIEAETAALEPAPAVPMPKPAVRETATTAADAAETPVSEETDDIAGLIADAEPADAGDPDDASIETRLAAAGDLWDQAPAASLSELVTMTEDRGTRSEPEEAGSPETAAAERDEATATASGESAPDGAPEAASPSAVVAPPVPEIAAEPLPKAVEGPTEPLSPAPPAPVEVAALPETEPAGAKPAEGKADGPAFGAASLPAAGSLGTAPSAPPKPAASGGEMVLTNVVVLDGGGFRAVRDRQGLIVRIAGIDPLPFDRVCEDASGASWRCGAKARAVLAQQLAGRMVDCEEVSVVKPKPVREVQARCALDGKDLATWLVAEGWASPAAGDGALAEAARTAEANRRGRFGAGG